MSRIYYADNLASGITVNLPTQASRHLISVLRMRVGDSLILFNGQGGQYRGQLSGVNKGHGVSQAVVEVQDYENVDIESTLNIHLMQAISRAEKMDYIIQKSVELGVKTITPLMTQRMSVKLNDEHLQNKMLHWQQIIISACEQCGRNHIPLLNPAMHFDVWLDEVIAKPETNRDIKFLLTPQAKIKLSEFKTADKNILIAIGSEGGFNDREIELAIEAGFIELQLGPRILRTETAALTMVAAMQALWGGFLMAIDFSAAELERYDRHFKLPVLGYAGQKKLRAAKVLCVGVGGLGAPACLYLAAAGVGNIGLLDDDVVELSNLQRQIIYSSCDINQPKAKIAQTRLQVFNPEINVVQHSEHLTAENAAQIFTNYDLVIDGSDNFETHYLVNEFCCRLQKPSIFATVTETSGRCSVFNAPGGPCYACLFPAPPPPHTIANCSEAGVLGVLPGLLGIIQAAEAIKLLAHIGESLIGRVLCIDIMDMRFHEYRLEKSGDCPVCGPRVISTQAISKNYIKEVNNMQSMSVEELQELLNENPEDICVLDVRRPDEYAICNIGGQLIPFAELPQRLSELDRNKHIVVHCRSGGRSTQATQLLMEAGFPRVSNLTGGIIAWADEIDSSLQKY